MKRLVSNKKIDHAISLSDLYNMETDAGLGYIDPDSASENLIVFYYKGKPVKVDEIRLVSLDE